MKPPRASSDPILIRLRFSPVSRRSKSPILARWQTAASPPITYTIDLFSDIIETSRLIGSLGSQNVFILTQAQIEYRFDQIGKMGPHGMATDKKIYSIKLTDLEKDRVTTLITTSNLNFINFHFRQLNQYQVDLKSCDYLADIDEQEDGVIKTVGINRTGFLAITRSFMNMRKEGLIS